MTVAPLGFESTSGRPGPARGGGTAAVAVSTCALGALYAWHGLTPPAPGGEAGATRWFGVDQWAFLGRTWPLLFLAAAVAAGIGIARHPEAGRRVAVALGRAADHRGVRLAVAVLTTAVCWVASTRQENLDGSLLQQKIAAAVPRTGAFVTHDEMLELYLHSRLWAVAHAWWGWDVAQTYRLTSCLAGGAAALLAVGLARRFPPVRRPLVVAGLFAGGWVLVFFGDVENYTLTNLVALGYLAAGLRFLDRDRARLWPVAGLFAGAALFHLEALVLGPSLLVLARTAWRRGRVADTVGGLALVPAVLAAALVWFDAHGLPIGDLAHSQISADGGDWSRYLARPDPGYLWQQLQLLLLLAPTVALLPAWLAARRPGAGAPRPAAGARRPGPGARRAGPGARRPGAGAPHRGAGAPCPEPGARRPAGEASGPAAPAPARSAHTPFLAAASAGGLLLLFVWRAQLGLVGDWNLYALVAQPLGLLVLGGLATAPRLRGSAPWITAMVVLSATHTASWIVENHHLPPT